MQQPRRLVVAALVTVIVLGTGGAAFARCSFPKNGSTRGRDRVQSLRYRGKEVVQLNGESSGTSEVAGR